MARAYCIIAVAIGLLGSGSVRAQSATYKCLDASGRLTYTNVKEEMVGKQCTVVSREVSVVPAPPKHVRRAAPRARRAKKEADVYVNKKTQLSRDETRRKILEEELEAAETRLENSRRQLVQQESAPDIGPQANPREILARIRANREEVERQEQNVTSLKRELANMRGSPD